MPPHLLLVRPPSAVQCHAYVDFYLERHNRDFQCQDDHVRGQIAFQRVVNKSFLVHLCRTFTCSISLKSSKCLVTHLEAAYLLNEKVKKIWGNVLAIS